MDLNEGQNTSALKHFEGEHYQFAGVRLDADLFEPTLSKVFAVFASRGYDPDDLPMSILDVPQADGEPLYHISFQSLDDLLCAALAYSSFIKGQGGLAHNTRAISQDLGEGAIQDIVRQITMLNLSSVQFEPDTKYFIPATTGQCKKLSL